MSEHLDLPDDTLKASDGGSSKDGPSRSYHSSDSTDNRAPYDGESRWPEDLQKAQFREGIYLAFLWILGLGGLFGLLLATPASNGCQSRDVATSMGLVFSAGLLGGTTFDMKWLYHTVARGHWHRDRRVWRIAVPWVAAIVALFVHILFKSDLIGVLNPAAFEKTHNSLALGFLVGYFSDSAIAKLAEIAESLFGVRSKR